MPRFAANLSMMFTEVPFLDRFGAAARAGFKGVEFLFPYEHDVDTVVAAKADAGVEIALFNMPPGDWDAGERGLACLPGREAEFSDGVAMALDYAKALDCPRLHVMAGLAPEGADRAELETVYCANLAHAAAALDGTGRTALIEPINTRDIPGFFLNYQADARRFQDRVGAANLRIQMDLYHVQIMEGDLAMAIRGQLDRVGHIQIAGVPERHEPDVGEINYPYLFALLDELGFPGWLGCEYRPKGRTEDGLGWVRPYLVDGPTGRHGCIAGFVSVLIPPGAPNQFLGGAQREFVDHVFVITVVGLVSGQMHQALYLVARHHHRVVGGSRHRCDAPEQSGFTAAFAAFGVQGMQEFYRTDGAGSLVAFDGAPFRVNACGHQWGFLEPFCWLAGNIQTAECRGYAHSAWEVSGQGRPVEQGPNLFDPHRTASRVGT